MKQIKIVPYDPEWPILFEQEASRIKKALGDNCIALHHVGSTSVPGLLAKPKIDIIAVVRKLSETPALLENVGYPLKGEFNIPFHLVFDKRGINNVNLHLYEEGNPEIELNLRFRDYLRQHPEAVNAYAELKQILLSRPESNERIPMGFSKYNLGKDKFIKDILNRAGFNGICLRYCTHHDEWEVAEQLNPSLTEDKAPEENIHFVIYEGPEVVGYALISFSENENAKIAKLILIPEKEYLEPQFTNLCNIWIQSKYPTEVPGQGNSQVHTL